MEIIDSLDDIAILDENGLEIESAMALILELVF
jgi:hypothetical protein